MGWLSHPNYLDVVLLEQNLVHCEEPEAHYDDDVDAVPVGTELEKQEEPPSQQKSELIPPSPRSQLRHLLPVVRYG